MVVVFSLDFLLEITFGCSSVGCLWIKDSSELPQLSSPGDDSAEADNSLNTETTSQYVWVSRHVQCDCF